MYRRDIKYVDEKVSVNVEIKEVIINESHWHECVEIIYVLEGKVDVVKVDHTYALEKGDMYIINSQDIHEIRKKENLKNTILVANIDSAYFKKVHGEMYEHMFECKYIKSVAKMEYLQKKKSAVEEIRDLLFKIYIINSLIDEEKENSIQGKINEKIYELIETDKVYIKKLEKKMFKEFDLINNLSSEKHDSILTQRHYQFMRYLCSNYDKKITLDDVANNLNLSKYYVSRLIKEYTGFKFIDFIRIFRTENGKRMLLLTDKSIADIAEITGCGNSGNFIKIFKERNKITPSEYRKIYKKDIKKEIDDCFNKKNSLNVIKKNMRDYNEFYESVNQGERFDIDINISEKEDYKWYFPKIKYNLYSDNIEELKLINSNPIYKINMKYCTITNSANIGNEYNKKYVKDILKDINIAIKNYKDINESLIIKGSNNSRKILFDNEGLETRYYYITSFLSNLYDHIIDFKENYILTTNLKGNYRLIFYVDKSYKESNVFNLNINFKGEKKSIKIFSAIMNSDVDLKERIRNLEERDRAILRMQEMPKAELIYLDNNKYSIKTCDKSLIYMDIAIK